MSTFQSKRASHRSFAQRYAGPAVIVCCLTALVRPALPATITDLGALTPAGTPSAAFGINASGQVVGASAPYPNAPAPGHAFLYSGGHMTDLNLLLPAGSGWQLSSATAINDSGQIVGYGLFDHQPAAFLLDTSETQSPEPGSLNLLGAGLVAVGLRRWLRPEKPRSSAPLPTRKS